MIRRDSRAASSPAPFLPAAALLALLALLTLAPACSPPPDDPEAVDPVPGPSTQSALEEDEPGANPLEHLRGLGYVAWDPGADPELAGVTLLDEKRAAPGYTLYSDATTAVHLIDLEGRPVHTWKIPNTAGNCEHAELSPDGRLALVCPARSLNMLDWNSNLSWKLPMLAHHDVAFLPGGNILVPYHRWEEYAGRRVLFDGIATISSRGEILDEWYIFDRLDHFRSRHPALPLDLPPEESGAGEPDPGYDYYHLNTIEILPDTGLGRRDARFRQGNILICLRNAGLVAILDSRTWRVVWDWGPGILDMPHTPRMLPSGRLLIFDNGYFRGSSRVIEVNPLSGEIAWSYQGDPPESFFSKVRGSSQRLENGNTLICESERGHAFEVTPAGEKVWEFWNPVMAGDRRKRIYRMLRLPEEQVAGLLAPGGF